jgi:hypothetical protein
VTRLPRDAALVELRADVLTFRTRECILPDSVVAFALELEGKPLELEAPVTACLVISRDRSGFMYHVQCDLAVLPGPDRQILALFIGKGRGAPNLQPPTTAAGR